MKNLFKKETLVAILFLIVLLGVSACTPLESEVIKVDVVKDNAYWLERIRAGDSFAEEEVQEIPYEVWYEITPEIYNVVDNNLLGASGESLTLQYICRGDGCNLIKERYQEQLGATVATGYKTTLRSSMTSSQNTIPVSSLDTPDGTTLTTAILGSRTFLTLEPGARKEEITMSTGIGTLQWTGTTRGLAFTGTSTSAVTANRETHNAGSIVIMANVHYVYDELVDKESTETIGGLKTFTTYPQYTDSTLCTDNEEFCTKRYIDTVGAGGLTSANVGDGKTLRANGTVPETLDSNTTTDGFFAIVTGGFFSGNASTTGAVAWNVDGIYFDWADIWDNNATIFNLDSLAPLAQTATTSADALHAHGKNIAIYQAAEDITLGQAVYSTSTGTTTGRSVMQTAAGTPSSTLPFVGFALETGSAGDDIAVQTSGIYTGASGLSADGLVYLQNATGTIGMAVGDTEGIVGWSVSATEINMDYDVGDQFIFEVTPSDGTEINTTIPTGARKAIVNFIISDGAGSYLEQVIVGSKLIRTRITSIADARVDVYWRATSTQLNLSCSNSCTNISQATVYFYR